MSKPRAPPPLLNISYNVNRDNAKKWKNSFYPICRVHFFPTGRRLDSQYETRVTAAVFSSFTPSSFVTQFIFKSWRSVVVSVFILWSHLLSSILPIVDTHSPHNSRSLSKYFVIPYYAVILLSIWFSHFAH